MLVLYDNAIWTARIIFRWQYLDFSLYLFSPFYIEFVLYRKYLNWLNAPKVTGELLFIFSRTILPIVQKKMSTGFKRIQGGNGDFNSAPTCFSVCILDILFCLGIILTWLWAECLSTNHRWWYTVYQLSWWCQNSEIISTLDRNFPNSIRLQ